MSRPDISTTPVWILRSYRAGENGQLLGLAERLGLPYRSIEVRYRAGAGPLGLFGAVSCAGITPESRVQFAPPWPRLLLTAGLRNEPLARWVQRASGGATRLVFVGRTWCSLQALDLLVTTPQYRIADGPRVQRNRLTQHRITPERLADQGETAHPLLAGLSGPVIGVLVGGSSGPYVLGARSALRLADTLRALQRRSGGALAVTTSARTSAEFVTALAEALPADARLYRWRPNDPDNPYFAMLSAADALVVTGDSVAMLSEAAATGRPVLIWDVPVDAAGDHSVAARAYRFMMRCLPDRLTRDVGIVHRELVSTGMATMLRANGEADGAFDGPPRATGPEQTTVTGEAIGWETRARNQASVQAEIDVTLRRLRALL